jgi:hypothetical protein
MHEYRIFFAFRPFRCFRPVCLVEPISAFYGQDGQEARNRVAMKSNWGVAKKVLISSLSRQSRKFLFCAK